LHSGPAPGKITSSRRHHQHHHRSARGRQGGRSLRRRRFGRQSQRDAVYDSIYAIATAKTNAEKAAVTGCAGCKVLSVEDTPIGDLSNRMGQLTTSLLSKYGKEWTYSIAVNDLYYDFSAPPLQAAGVDPAAGYPRKSPRRRLVPAFQRIRDKRYQIATVAEPLHLHGWPVYRRTEPRLRRPAASTYVAPVHLFTSANIDKDGGAQNIFDPGNGYRMNTGRSGASSSPLKTRGDAR